MKLILYSFCVLFKLISSIRAENNIPSNVNKIINTIKNPFVSEYEWTYANFTWESNSAYEEAVNQGRYVPENNAITGIKFYKNHLYMALGRLRTGTPVTLAYISQETSTKKNPLLSPFPSWKMNVQDDCSTLQSVIGMEIDKEGIMWVIDGVRINNNTKCPAKLVLLDLNNNGDVVHTFNFPNKISSNQGGFLNDIVVDESDGGFAYITDNSEQKPGLIVYSKAQNKAWKFFDCITMSPALDAANFVVDGTTIPNLAPIDGIALSSIPKNKNQERFVFFSALTAFNLYKISTKVLKNKALVKTDSWKKQIQFVGVKQSQSDGMVMDNEDNLHYTLLSLYGAAVWNINRNFKTSRIFARDTKRLVWPDTFAFDGNGFMYLLADHIYRFAIPTYKLQLSKSPVFRVMKMYTGTKSYLYPKQ